MINIYSKNIKDKILHLIFKKSEFKNRQDLINQSEFLQVASLVLDKNQTFKPHKHIYKSNNNNKIITQESWVVIEGKVRVDYYDIDNEFLVSHILDKGDCTITLYGGHNYTSLTNDSLVYEFKTGPYEGQLKDKVLIE